MNATRWIIATAVVLASCAGGDAPTVAVGDAQPSQRVPEPSALLAADAVSDAPAPSSCMRADEAPLTRAQAEALGLGPSLGTTLRTRDDSEEDGGSVVADDVSDDIALGTAPLPSRPLDRAQPRRENGAGRDVSGDDDGDCLSNAQELIVGTSPSDPDSDDDGWFDGPCNERRTLVLARITAHDEQEDAGEDELYLIADDIRWPNADLDGFWSFDDNESQDKNIALASRTIGLDRSHGLAVVSVEAFEDDYEAWNEWLVDDFLFAAAVDIGAHVPGRPFIARRSGDGDWEYELSFRVIAERFADPDPLANGDRDQDGIRDADESRMARDFGGIADPTRKDMFVELDWMPGHELATQAKRLVTTQLYRHGVQANIWRNEAVSLDPCLTVPQARELYNTRFTRRNYRASRYLVVSEQIWNDASGVTWGDMCLIDDSTWWIDGDVLAQAGTLIHELGHSLSLVNGPPDTTVPGEFHGIDQVFFLSYGSAMNYSYQATLVDYSSEGAGGGSHDHNDWEDVAPAHGLRWSFSRSTSTESGICD